MVGSTAVECGPKILHAASAGLAPSAEVTPGRSPPRKKILLLDVMSTLVRDPFYDDMPKFFQCQMSQLLAEKHPTAWIDFEKGTFTEEELHSNFFLDKREFDYQALKACMRNGYAWLEGCEELLGELQGAGYEMHAFTNYPCWYTIIEEKLRLSRYLRWTFVSCHTGLRKPDHAAYLAALDVLKCAPSDCVFVDDRKVNVDAAVACGMAGITFRDAEQLRAELTALGCPSQ